MLRRAPELRTPVARRRRSTHRNRTPSWKPTTLHRWPVTFRDWPVPGWTERCATAG